MEQGSHANKENWWNNNINNIPPVSGDRFHAPAAAACLCSMNANHQVPRRNVREELKDNHAESYEKYVPYIHFCIEYFSANFLPTEYIW